MAKEKEKKFLSFFDTPRIKFHWSVKISIFSLKIELFPDIRKFISEEKDTKSVENAFVSKLVCLSLLPLINKLNVYKHEETNYYVGGDAAFFVCRVL